MTRAGRRSLPSPPTTRFAATAAASRRAPSAQISTLLFGAGQTLPRLVTSTLKNSHPAAALMLLSLWRIRYADKLSEIDPGDVLA